MFPTNPLIAPLALLALLPALTTSLILPNYTSIITSTAKPGILDVTIHTTNNTINLWNADFVANMKDLVSRLKDDNDTKVVVFRSDVPKYFIAHADLNFDLENPTLVTDSIQLIEDVANLRQTTIGLVSGVVRGGGNEFLVSLDMRFATKTHTFLGQPEVGIGFIPGLGGIQWLARLIGRGRAMEYILTGKDINANDAERIGWINKAFDTDVEMEGYVASLTSRLALFDLAAIGAGKYAVNVATKPAMEASLADGKVFVELFKDPAVAARTRLGTLNDNDGERFFGEVLPALYGAGPIPSRRR
ncbi:enoyl-CoA hydratase/isomerase family protein [Leptodontidium sp. 2 PMI_412]|nr:enoyl-CoA hydratase/isomerase family protein [Leptodontidium sp. 2 PMI_412]